MHRSSSEVWSERVDVERGRRLGMASEASLELWLAITARGYHRARLLWHSALILFAGHTLLALGIVRIYSVVCFALYVPD